MNPYGRTAQQHWQQHLPTRYAQIPDPQSYFTQLGEEIQEEIEQRAATIAGDDPPGETYLQKLGRLNEATLTARSDVLRERLPDPEAEDPPNPDDPANPDPPPDRQP